LDFDAFKAGSYRKGYQYQYFLPEKINHPFLFSDPDIGGLLERASLKLGELNSFSRLVPDTGLFIAMHISKEPVVSIKDVQGLARLSPQGGRGFGGGVRGAGCIGGNDRVPAES
jgi:hypothetical protein